MGTLLQEDVGSTVSELLRLIVNKDRGRGRLHRELQITQAVVHRYGPALGQEQRQVVGLQRLHRRDAVVGKAHVAGHEAVALDAQLLGAGRQVDPVLAGIIAYVADDVALELGTRRCQLHLDQGAGLAVQVVAAVLAGGDVVAGSRQLFHRQFLCCGSSHSQHAE